MEDFESITDSPSALSHPKDQSTDIERRLDLDLKKMEYRKLSAEVDQISLKWWQRPAYVGSMVPIVLALLGFLTATLTGYFSDIRSQLNDQISALKSEKRILSEEKNLLTKSVADARQSAHLEIMALIAQKEDFAKDRDLARRDLEELKKKHKELLNRVKQAESYLTTIHNVTEKGISIRIAADEDRLVHVLELHKAGADSWREELTNALLNQLEIFGELHVEGSGITDEVLERLHKVRAITSLDLRFSNVTNNGLQHISKMARLEKLNLGQSAVNDQGLRHVAAVKTLREITLEGRSFTSGAVAFLESMGQLHRMVLADTRFTEEAIQRLQGVISGLDIRIDNKLTRGSTPAYLIVRGKQSGDDTLTFDYSLMSPAAANVIVGEKQVAKSDLQKSLNALTKKFGWSLTELNKISKDLSELVLPDNLTDMLRHEKDRHLVIVHDRIASLIPWETLSMDDWFPASGYGLSRRYSTEDLSAVRSIPTGGPFNFLLVVNPQEDLPGAEQEGKVIQELLELSGVRVTTMRGRKATKQAIMAALKSNQYDGFHFVGHGFFDESNPSLSGILGADSRNVLTGQDLNSLPTLPKFVFISAAEVGRLGIPSSESEGEVHVFGEVILKHGSSTFISTYWTEADYSAMLFVSSLYRSLTTGETVGDAIVKARRELERRGMVDCFNYMHYGDFKFAFAQPYTN
jgi:hypothetical protein